ncbi:hypothetical protein VTO73DRAFT_7404 [Trametes versicolor]
MGDCGRATNTMVRATLAPPGLQARGSLFERLPRTFNASASSHKERSAKRESNPTRQDSSLIIRSRLFALRSFPRVGALWHRPTSMPRGPQHAGIDSPNPLDRRRTTESISIAPRRRANRNAAISSAPRNRAPGFCAHAASGPGDTELQPAA